MPSKRKMTGPPKKPMPKKTPMPRLEIKPAILRKTPLRKLGGAAYHTRTYKKKELLINGLKSGKGPVTEGPRRRRKRKTLV